MNLNRSALIRAMAFTFSLGLIIFATGAVAAAATLTGGNATSGACPHVFTSIQSAVTAASAGDTVQVCPGTHHESVTISTIITLIRAKATVDAPTRPTTGQSL